jgi:hypothetical protein
MEHAHISVRQESKEALFVNHKQIEKYAKGNCDFSEYFRVEQKINNLWG